MHDTRRAVYNVMADADQMQKDVMEPSTKRSLQGKGT